MAGRRVSPGTGRLPAVVALLTVYIAWGATYPAIRVLGRTVPPLLAMGARFLLAGALLFAVLAVSGRSRLACDGRARLRAAAVGGWIFGDIGLIAWSERHVGAGAAALVIASVPLWVVVLRLRVGPRPHRTELLAVAAGLAGLVAVVRPGAEPVAPGWMLLLVAAAMIEASGEVAGQRLVQPPDPFTATAWQLTGAGALLLAAGAALGETGHLHPSRFTHDTAIAFAFLVLPGSVLAGAALVWLLASRPVQLAATYAYVNPVVAVLLGWALLGERLGPATLAGAALVLASVAVAVRAQPRGPGGGQAAGRPGDSGGQGAPHSTVSGGRPPPVRPPRPPSAGSARSAAPPRAPSSRSPG